MQQPEMDIDHVAALARLALTEEEKTALAKELPSILSFVQAIGEADAGGVSHSAKGGVASSVPPRADKASDSSLANDLVAAAPETEERYVKTRAVFDR